MTADQIAALVTGGVALMAAVAAYLRSLATQASLGRHSKAAARQAHSEGQSCTERKP